jgi:hypothetical protein
MQTAVTSETSVNVYQRTRRNIPEDSNVQPAVVNKADLFSFLQPRAHSSKLYDDICI